MLKRNPSGLEDSWNIIIWTLFIMWLWLRQLTIAAVMSSSELGSSIAFLRKILGFYLSGFIHNCGRAMRQRAERFRKIWKKFKLQKSKHVRREEEAGKGRKMTERKKERRKEEDEISSSNIRKDRKGDEKLCQNLWRNLRKMYVEIKCKPPLYTLGEHKWF